MNSKSFTQFLFKFHLLTLFFLLLIRIGFATIHVNALHKIAFANLAQGFIVGTLIDSSVISTILFLPLLVFGLAGFLLKKDFRLPFLRIAITFILLVFLINIIDIYYFAQYGTRLNLMVSEGVQRYAIIFSLIWKSYPVVKLLLVFFIISFLFYKIARNMLTAKEPEPSTKFKWLPIQLGYLIIASFLYYGPPFWHLTSFSESTTLNQLSSNGVYTFIKAIDQKNIFDRDLASYSFHDENQAMNELRNVLKKKNENFIDNYYPTLREFSPSKNCTAKNIVIIMMESFAARNIGCLGGKQLSPNFDRFAKKGVLFTDCFASGVRTQHGLTATVGSFPPLLGSSLIRRKGFIEFSTIGNLVRQANYQTIFLHNGHSGYGDTDFFLKQGGFQTIGDEADYKNWKFRNELGVSDEDLFEFALKELKKKTSQPKLTLLLTMSNHAPHEVPAYFLAKYPALKTLDKKEITFAYSDYALGNFLDSCKGLPDFENTLFLIVADHGEIYDETDYGYKVYHIPALLLNSSQPVGTFSKTCSQIDFAPSLLYEAGFNKPFNCLGQNLFAADYLPFAFSKDYESKITLTMDNQVMQWDMRSNSPFYFSLTADKHLIQADNMNAAVKQKMKLFTENYLQSISNLYRNGRYRIRN